MDKDFFWGAATSAHQVEGGNHNDWTEWEIKNANRLAQIAKSNPPAGGWPDYILRNYPNPLQKENYISGRACDHYNRFEEDFDITKSLGHNAHRFSIEWSRIEPKEGKFNEKEIEHYRQVITALRERGLEPFVTIWHWSIPIWLQDKGGLLSSMFPFYFGRYAEYLAKNFVGEVTFWITINEPEIYSHNAFFVGRWLPQKKNIFLLLRALQHLKTAHKKAYRVIKKINPIGEVGIAKHNIYFEAYKNRFLNKILKKCADWWWNFSFLNAVKNYQDFIGLNHYFHNRIKNGFNKNENKITSDMGWELYPESIYCALKDLKKYGRLIYITESGLADAQDAKRAWYIRETVRQIKRAIAEGVDVRGYFHWSLLDNFEWADGFWPRFGLVEIDYRTLKRKIRPSAWEYKKIIEKWLHPSPLEDQQNRLQPDNNDASG